MNERFVFFFLSVGKLFVTKETNLIQEEIGSYKYIIKYIKPKKESISIKKVKRNIQELGLHLRVLLGLRFRREKVRF
jgi:hypothetical protein